MRRLLIFFFTYVSIAYNASAQVAGDYRSAVATGNWNAIASWEKYDGAIWQPLGANDWPGNLAASGTVTIRDGHTITLNTSPANNIGALTIGEGTSGSFSTSNADWTLNVTNDLNVLANATMNFRRVTLGIGGNAIITGSTNDNHNNGAVNITGNLTITAITGSMNLQNGTYTVTGTTNVNGTITDDNNNGTVTFSGLFTVSVTGSFFTNNNSAFTFGNGIINNNIFTKTGNGTITLSADQTITANAAMTMRGAITTGAGIDIIIGGNNVVDWGNSQGGNISIGGNLTINNNADLQLTSTGTLDVTGTTQVDGTFTHTTNGGINTFSSLVTVSATGTFTSTSVTTNANMVFNGGITNTGVCNIGGTTIGAGQTITATTAITIANGMDGAGNLTIAGVGGVTVNGGNGTVSGNLTINNGASLTLNTTGTFDVTGTTQIDGSFTDGANNNATTFTGLVTISATGTFTSTAVTTNARMVFNGGLTNVGICNLGGCTIGAGQTITATAAVSSANGIDGAGNLIITGAGGVTSNGTGSVTGNLTINASSFYNCTGGNNSIGGNLSIAAAASMNISSTGNFTVTGTTQVDGSFTDSDNSAANNFTGLVTINGTGTWTSTAVTTQGRMNFLGGLTNTGTCNPGGATFGAGTAINTTNAIDFIEGADGNGNLTITGGGGVTFSGSTGCTISGNLVVNAGNSLLVSTASIFDVTGTTTIDGSFTDNNNSNANDFTGLVTINGTGTWTSTAVTTQGRMNFLGGLTNTGTCNPGGATFGAGTAINTTNAIDFIEGADGNGNLTITGGGGITFSGSTNCSVAGNLIIDAGNSLIVSSTNTFTVTGTTNVNGNFVDSDNSSVSTFTGLVTIGAAGTWTTTAITTTNRLVFDGGITNNNSTAGSFIAGGARFNTNPQTISGSGSLSFANNVLLDNGIVVTNQNTNTITITGTLDGNDVASNWINDNGSSLVYENATMPFNGNGFLTASTSSNTVTYNGSIGTAYSTTYHNLIISSPDNITINSATTVNNQLTLLSGAFTVGANLTMADNSIISRDNGSLTAAPTFGANVNLIYTASCATGFEVPATASPASGSILDNLTMNTSGGNVTLATDMSMKGTLTWSSDGLLILSTFDLTIAEGASFSGNTSSRFIQTNSTGNIVKEGTVAADFEITYPTGTGTLYTPMQITTVTSAGFGAPGNVTVRATGSVLPYVPGGVNALTKYWVVASSFVVTTVDVNFTFVDPDELVGTVTNYEPRIGDGASLSAVTGPSATGSTPTFSSTGHNTLTGDWTYVDPTGYTPQTYYSYQNGDWSDPTTWTRDPAGVLWLNDGTEYPGKLGLDSAVILTNTTVYTTTSRNIKLMQINSGGILDLQTTTSNNFTVITGQGKMRLNSVVLPSGTLTSFVANGGGTIEYYDVGGVSGTNISSTQLTYNNLLITNSTATNHKLILPNPTNPINFTINGSLQTSVTGAGTMTLQLGYTATNVINLNIEDSLSNGTNCYITVASVDAIHNITLTGNLNNNGFIDWSNSAQFVTSTNGAANLIFTGASDKSMVCNGQTDIYSLTVNMGVDETYILSISSSAATNFNIFTSGQNITLTKGTLKLLSSISLNRLGVNNAQFDVDVGTRLWIDGANVLTDGFDNGIRIRNVGTLLITSGTASFSNIGINVINSGQFIMSGGTVTAEALINGGAGAGDGYFEMSGGTFTLDGALSGNPANDLARFAFADSNSSINISGGTINIYDPISTGNVNYAGLALGCKNANYSVTGGTWNIYIPASAVDFHIASRVPFYDLNIYKEGAGTAVAKLKRIGGDFSINASNLTVLHDFTIDGTNNPTFDANGYNVTVGGNFTITAGGIYLPNINTTTFNGPQTYGRTNQTFSINTTVSRKTNLVVNKSAGTLTMAGTSNFDCLSGLTITQGTFDDGGKNIDVCGDITHSGTHSGTGSIIMQRGVRSANVTAGGGYTLPTMTVSAGTETTPATFNLTIKDGVITDISIVSGGAYSTNGTNRTVTFGTGSASARALTQGGTVTDIWIVNGGSGYGPTASGAGGGGAGAVYQAVITGTTSTAPGAGTLTAVNILATGEGYTSNPTITISSGAATATANTTTIPSIGGSGNGIFTNLSQNNDLGSIFTANQSVNGNLRLAQGVMDIASFSLALSGTSNIYDGLAGTGTTFGSTKMIKTGGLSSNGGLIKTYSASMLGFVFPLGTTSIYTPANITLSAAPTVYGSITVRPVESEHPLVSATGQSLTYYWRTTSSGFTLGAATVTQVYTYDQSDVIDNGTTILESEYVPGKYDPTVISWTTNADMAKVDEAVNTITFDGATFNTTIDGDYTAGDQTPSDPFSTILTFYSITTGNWTDGNTWSTTGHGGAAAGSPPASNSIVRVGDGVTYNHTVTVDADSQASGALAIASGSVLDLALTFGHNFGTYDTSTVGEGKLRISSGGVLAQFPAGDFADFLSSYGGTVEYYTIGVQDFSVPTTSDAPSSLTLNSYKNLILTPATGQYIEMPNLNLTVYNDFTVQGVSSTGVARLNSTTTRTLSIGRNLNITSGNLQFRNGTAQNLSITGDVSVNTGAIFNIANTATAITNTMVISDSLINNGTFDMSNGTDVCNITFTGSANAAITGSNGAAITDFNNVIVNKGSSQTPILNINIAGTLTAPNPTNNWLTLTNGTFRFSKASTLTISNVASQTFSIPSTACLSINNAGATVGLSMVNNNNADVLLSGKLEIIDGTVLVGNTSGNNNDIEYSSTGSPEINIQGGSLTVNGKIRRPTSVTGGALIYNQSGGNVSIVGRGNATRASLEVANTGTFNMSGTSTLTLVRSGGTTFGDLYIVPGSSTVTGGTIIFSQGAIATDYAYILNSSVTLNNITVTGNGTNTAIVDLNINPLTLTGDLTISNNNSYFRANGLNMTFTSSGDLINSNTSAATGITSGGYQPGTTTQLTTFSSSTTSQVITGTVANLTNFGALTINNSFGSVSLSANTEIRINGNLTISSTFSDGGNTATVIGNISNSSTHSGAGKITLAGSSLQTISGTGTYQNLELNNASGAVTTSNITINGTFTLTSGILDIDANRLTLGSSANIGGTPGSTKMIVTNGSLSDLGIIKNYPAAASDFTFPVGVGSIYTPAQFNVTTNGAVGTITLRVFNGKHPSTQDAGNKELLYYWNVISSGFSGLTVTHTYTYDQSDVQGTEASYVTGRFFSNDWVPANGIGSTVNDVANTMTLTGVNYIDGDYTAGESTEFTALLTYYSRNATLGGNWDDLNSWSTTGHAGAAAAVIPSGNPIVIAVGHTINANGFSRTAVTSSIDGTLNLANYIGQNLGTVTGTGTIQINATAGGSFILPAGNFTTFTALGGGTFEFGGPTNGTLPTLNTYNNILFSGTSTKTLPTVNITINNSLNISAGVLSNTTNNITVDMKGNWTNGVGAGGFAAGTGKVTFSGSGAQAITGVTTFYDLEIANSGNTVTLNNNINLSRRLNFTTSGYIDLNGNTLTMNNWANGNIPTLTTDRYVLINGGDFTINGVNNGETAQFPVGLSTSVNDFCRVDIANSDAANTSFTLDDVCNYVNTTGSCTGGSQVTSYGVDLTYFITSASTNAIVTMYWHTSKEMSNFFRTNCHTQHYTGGAWTLIGAAGAATNLSGLVYYKSGATTSFSPFGVGTNNVPLPIELLSFLGIYKNNVVELNWTTATEQFTSHYEIERLSDNSNLKVIAHIPAAGFSYEILYYSTVDEAPSAGTNYYRLKQIDIDDKYTYSDWIAITAYNQPLENLVIYPNPITDIHNINIMFTLVKEQAVQLILTDIQGKIVFEKNISCYSGVQTHSLKDIYNVNDLNPGNYILTLIEEATISNQKISIVR